MELTTVWFVIIAFFWFGYLVLEGFDFGVGLLMPVLSEDERERRAVLNTIGPVWDGNEVWLIVAGGATFAAFPEWYATLFSGFYLPLFVILIALILRACAFEYRGKRPDPAWKARWDLAIFWGSLVPAVLWGVALANIVRGVPIDADGEFVGTVFDLLNPYALLGGLTTLLLFTTHGAAFIALKTLGDVRTRARSVGMATGLAAIPVAGGFVLWTALEHASTAVTTLGGLAAVALILAVVMHRLGREGWAFTATAACIGLATIMLFTALFPDVMPSSLDPAWSLTTTNAASTPYTLTLMTWAAVAFTPLVIGYQAWSYWVFRKRIGAEQMPV